MKSARSVERVAPAKVSEIEPQVASLREKREQKSTHFYRNPRRNLYTSVMNRSRNLHTSSDARVRLWNLRARGDEPVFVLQVDIIGQLERRREVLKQAQPVVEWQGESAFL